MSYLIPPMNFGMVEDNIYRSGEPTHLNFPFLNSLRLKTLLYLADEIPSASLLAFVNDHQPVSSGGSKGACDALTLIHLDRDGQAMHYTTSNAHPHSHVNGTTTHGGSVSLYSTPLPTASAHGSNMSSSWNPNVSEELVISALRILLDPNRTPCLVMCHLGRHRTGTVIGCLRKLQRWNYAAIFAEYRRFAGNKVRVRNEQFIELFDTDLVPARVAFNLENHPLHPSLQKQKSSSSSYLSLPSDSDRQEENKSAEPSSATGK